MPVHTALGTDANLVCPTCGEVAAAFRTGEGGDWHRSTLAPCGHTIATGDIETCIVGDDVLVPIVLGGARLDAALAYCNTRARLCADAARRLRAGERACDCDDPQGCAAPDWSPVQYDFWAGWWADAALAHWAGDPTDGVSVAANHDPPLRDPGSVEVTPATVIAGGGRAPGAPADPADVVLLLGGELVTRPLDTPRREPDR
jgi:hypothetical protein